MSMIYLPLCHLSSAVLQCHIRKACCCFERFCHELVRCRVQLPHACSAFDQRPSCIVSDGAHGVTCKTCASGNRRYAIGFGDRTGDGLSGVVESSPNVSGYPGVNGGTSTNNPFLGTRFFALKNLPWNQYNLWYFQWTVRSLPCPDPCCIAISRPLRPYHLCFSLREWST